MIFRFKPISDEEFLLNRLRMLSSLSVPLLAQELKVDELDIMEHPDFETEGNKMIDRITF